MAVNRLDELRSALRQFNDDRDWSQYHTVKNLTMALASEVGELAAVTRWSTPAALERGQLDDESFVKLRDEIGDIFLTLLTLCDRLDLDPVEAGERKLHKNGEKYPANASVGRAEAPARGDGSGDRR